MKRSPLNVNPMFFEFLTLLCLVHTENENGIDKMLETIVNILNALMIFGLGRMEGIE